MYAGRNQIVARALRRGFLQHRRLNFQKALLVKITACHLHDAVAQSQVALHGRAAQVEIAVLQAQLIVDLLVIGNLKRCGLRFGEHADIRDDNFNFAGGHLFVDRALVAANDIALDSEHIFRAHAERNVKQRGIDRLIKCALHDTGAVAQQQEQHAAVVARAVAPAVDDDFPSVICGAQLAAPCGALHTLNGCIHKANNLPGAPCRRSSFVFVMP